jgi:hypothetical protein
VIQQRILAPSRSQVHPIITAGLLVGILDILAAFIVLYWFTRASPVRVLQGIASGLLGPAAFTGGAGTAVLGMFLHLAIAFAVAAIYYGASRRWRFLVQHPILSGILYGVGVHWVMNGIVLPLSRLPMGPRTPPFGFTPATVVVHMLCVGLPIALTVARRDVLMSVGDANKGGFVPKGFRTLPANSEEKAGCRRDPRPPAACNPVAVLEPEGRGLRTRRATRRVPRPRPRASRARRSGK